MITLCTSICWLLGGAVPQETPARPFIHASDTVFMYPAGDPSQYDAYKGTVVGWGGRPRLHAEQDIQSFQQRVAHAHERQMRYCGSVDFLVDFGGFIDFCSTGFMDAVTRDLDGNPLRVPWLWDHEHKGNPSYWFCTNNPDYQAYLRDQVERVCLAPVDGLHIDDYSGSSASSSYNGGCFCPHCMSGFRRYLKERYNDRELQQMGVDDVDAFEYAALLKTQGISADQFRPERQGCPLGRQFQDFQNEQMKQVVGAMFTYAEELRGMPLVRSVNSSASSPRTLVVSPLLDYFCGEVPHHASGQRVPLEPVFVFRLVEAVERRQTATGAGQDWAWIKANERPGLVRTWIAQAYAFGSVFMVPHRQWCYTQELGTHWWNGKPEDFAPTYHFVRDHTELLDGYASLAQVGLVYANTNFTEVREAALKLAEANIPYTILVAGDGSLPLRLSANALEPFAHLITGANPLPDGQEELLGQSKAEVLRWEGIPSLPLVVTESITVEGSSSVRVSLRHRQGVPDAPIACHVVNLDYDPDVDDVRTGDVSIAIDTSLLGTQVGSVVRHVPDRDSEEIAFTVSDGKLSFSVTPLGLWSLVELRPVSR